MASVSAHPTLAYKNTAEALNLLYTAGHYTSLPGSFFQKRGRLLFFNKWHFLIFFVL
jgi:hypothetical protein